MLRNKKIIGICSAVLFTVALGVSWHGLFGPDNANDNGRKNGGSKTSVHRPAEVALPPGTGQGSYREVLASSRDHYIGVHRDAHFAAIQRSLQADRRTLERLKETDTPEDLKELTLSISQATFEMAALSLQ